MVFKFFEWTIQSVFWTLESLNETEKYLNKEKNISKISEFCANFLKEFNEASFENFHALGHGVGLEIHEVPGISRFNQTELKDNSIITLEPSVYFSDKFGIRIEDMILVGQKSKVLTNSNKNLMILN